MFDRKRSIHWTILLSILQSIILSLKRSLKRYHYCGIWEIFDLTGIQFKSLSTWGLRGIHNEIPFYRVIRFKLKIEILNAGLKWNLFQIKHNWYNKSFHFSWIVTWGGWRRDWSKWVVTDSRNEGIQDIFRNIIQYKVDYH